MLCDDLGEKIFFSEVLEFLRVVFNVIENHDNYNIWLGILVCYGYFVQ